MKKSALFLFFVLTACGHNYPGAQTILTADQAMYHLHPNDVIQLRVYGEEELTGKYIVDSQGRIALPLAGKVSLGGQSEHQAAQIIRQKLQSGGYLKNAKVSVELFKARPFYVMGEVEKAGSFSFQSGVTVYQAVAMAGGYTYRADRDDITIRRQSGQGAGTELRYSAYEDTPVLPGDVVEVGERYF